MAQAKMTLRDGRKVEALNLYRKAADECGVPLVTAIGFKPEAMFAAESLSKEIFTEWDKRVSLMIIYKLAPQARFMLDSLPGNLLLSDAAKLRIKWLKCQVDKELAEKEKRMIKSLLQDIYHSNGKLTDSIMANLDTMLMAKPDSYWLKIIQTQSRSRIQTR